MNERFGKLYQEVIITGVWAELSPIAKAVYPVLLRYAHICTKVCMPTQRTIAKDAGIYWRSVKKAAKILEEHKLINTWTKLWHGKRRVHYEILDPKTGIVPSGNAIYPPKKRQISTARDLKGRFISSSAVRDGIYSALRDGRDSAVPNGNKREILKRDKKETQNPLSFSNNETTKPYWVTNDMGAYHFFSVEYRQGLYRKYGKDGKDKLINATLKFGLVDREFDNPLSEQELAKITECIESEGKDGKEIPKS